MKTTGVIKRIDELGRIVIPKEIRKSLRIKNGESLEVYLDGDSINSSIDDDITSIKKEIAIIYLYTISEYVSAANIYSKYIFSP